MTSELVKCPHCGFQYPTDVEKIVDDGKTHAVRLGISDIKNKFSKTACKSLFIDLRCPNCKKIFEWEVMA